MLGLLAPAKSSARSPDLERSHGFPLLLFHLISSQPHPLSLSHTLPFRLYRESAACRHGKGPAFGVHSHPRYRYACIVLALDRFSTVGNKCTPNDSPKAIRMIRAGVCGDSLDVLVCTHTLTLIRTYAGAEGGVSVQLKDTKRAFAKRNVLQLEAVPELNLLVSLSGVCVCVCMCVCGWVGGWVSGCGSGSGWVCGSVGVCSGERRRGHSPREM